MDVVKIGGPVYRIGVGGGAASSIKVIIFKKKTFLKTTPCLLDVHHYLSVSIHLAFFFI